MTNGFFLLIVIQPFVPQIVEMFEYREVHTIEALFDKWGFTPTEKEIAILVVNGKTTAEIAEMKFIGEATVRKHISNLMGKADVKVRHEFVTKVKVRLDNTDL